MPSIRKTTTALLLALSSTATAWAEAGEDGARVAVPVEAATRAQTNAAVKLYRQGVEHFEKQEHQPALEAFQRSLAQVDSPNSRLMVARCLDKLNRVSEAYREFERVLREATALAEGLKKYEDTRDAAKKELDQLRARVALVHLETDGEVSLDGTALPSAESQPLVLLPGEVTLALELQNGERVERKLTLAAGAEESVSLMLPKPAPEPVPTEPPPARVEYRKDPDAIERKTLGYVGLGVAGAGAVGFAVFGLLTKSQFEDIDGQCTNGRCPASLRDDAETGRFYQSAANVSLGLGLVGLGTGLYFLFTGNSVAASTEGEFEANDPEIAVGPNELLLRGHF